jgi:DNA-binding transcriptional ArsR family regulator
MTQGSLMDDFLAIAKALSDESRLRILCNLDGEQLCLSQFTGALGLAPSTISRHLHQLAKAGLVTARRQGRWRYYRLATSEGDPCARSALEWLLEFGVRPSRARGHPALDKTVMGDRGASRRAYGIQKRDRPRMVLRPRSEKS